MNSFIVELSPVDISNIMIDREFKLGGQSSDLIETVEVEINNFFANSTTELPQLGVDYEILGLNNGLITQAGKQAIQVKAIYTSKLLTGSFTIDVQTIKTANGRELFDVSYSNYLLTDHGSI
jgi:hypothetical protein